MGVDRETRLCTLVRKRRQPGPGEPLQAVAIAMKVPILGRMRCEIGDGIQDAVTGFAKLACIAIAKLLDMRIEGRPLEGLARWARRSESRPFAARKVDHLRA